MLQPLTQRPLATLLTLAGLTCAAVALPANAQNRAVPSSQVQQDQLPNDENSNAMGVEQLSSPRSSQSVVEQIPAHPTVRTPENGTGETANSSEPSKNDAPLLNAQKGAVYTAMANAWSRLRSQGQQPTPELMVQEVGQETFNMFLNMFPGAELIFAIDSDQFPLSIPN